MASTKCNLKPNEWGRETNHTARPVLDTEDSATLKQKVSISQKHKLKVGHFTLNNTGMLHLPLENTSKKLLLVISVSL